MIDRHLLPLLARLLAPPARWLAEHGVTANAVTAAGLGFGGLAAGLVALGWYRCGLAAFLLNRLCDGLDGAIARRLGATDRGAFLDIAWDFVVYAALPFGFAVADPGRNALAAAGLLFGFMGTASSFLAFAVIAAKRGLSNVAYPSKGIFYLGGLTEGGETMACLAAMCLWPDWFPVLAWGFAALCGMTTLTRWLAGIRAFSA